MGASRAWAAGCPDVANEPPDVVSQSEGSSSWTSESHRVGEVVHWRLGVDMVHAGTTTGQALQGAVGG